MESNQDIPDEILGEIKIQAPILDEEPLEKDLDYIMGLEEDAKIIVELNKKFESDTPEEVIVRYATALIHHQKKIALDWLLTNTDLINHDHLYSFAKDFDLNDMISFLLDHKSASFTPELLLTMVKKEFYSDFIRCINNKNTFNQVKKFKQTLMFYLKEKSYDKMEKLIYNIVNMNEIHDPIMLYSDGKFVVDKSPTIPTGKSFQIDLKKISEECMGMSDEQMCQLMIKIPLYIKFIGFSALNKHMSLDGLEIEENGIKLWIKLTEIAVKNDGMALKFVLEQIDFLIRVQEKGGITEKINFGAYKDYVIKEALKNNAAAIQYLKLEDMKNENYIKIVEEQNGGYNLVYLEL